MYPPPIQLAINTIRAKLDEWKCNKIFLATEDKSIEQTLKDTFGESCITFDKEFVDYSNSNKVITSFHFDRANDNFLQGKEYLIEMLILTKCNSLVMARGFGAVGVMILGEHFENVYLFNLGQYGIWTADIK